MEEWSETQAERSEGGVQRSSSMHQPMVARGCRRPHSRAHCRHEKLSASQRKLLVRAVRAGLSQRDAARRFGTSLSCVQYWLAQAGARRLDRVQWQDRRRGPRTGPVNATSTAIILDVLVARAALKAGVLGECGAQAVWEHLRALHPGRKLPCVRTIARLLARHGCTDSRRRVRRPPPPRGWYLPSIAQGKAEMDCADIVEGLVIAGGQRVEVFNLISLHGALAGSWPAPVATTTHVLDSLCAHWRAHGLPHYAQFDNDTIFQGPHHYADIFGRVVRLCLALGVTPVFAPPRELGLQAAIESYNARWQARVWRRWHHRNLAALHKRNDAYVRALQHKVRARAAQAPARRPWPQRFRFDPKAPLKGTVIYVRRTDASGRVSVLGHVWKVSAHWPHRLVRAEVDFTRRRIRFYALRRADSTHQPLLRTHRYQPPREGVKRKRASKDIAKNK